MKYKLKRIYLENFKLISTKGILIDEFENLDFVILDGPNGYGKTTIFDAIEIALTGKIHRISQNQIVPGNQGAEDIVYLNDQSKVMKIVVEFYNETDTKIIYVHGKAGAGLSKTDKKVSNPNYFERYILDNFVDHNDSISNLIKIEQKEIDTYFNLPNRFYNLYHYVQQEDSTFFLKLKENDRMERLGKLFDTEKEDSEQKIVKNILDKVIAEIVVLEAIVSKNDIEITNIKRNIIEDIDDLIEYDEIFNYIEISPLWDTEHLTGLNIVNTDGLTRRDIFKNEIFLLKNFIENFADNHNFLKKHKKNLEIEDKVKNSSILKLVLLIANFIDDLDEIKLTFAKRLRIIEFQKNLKKESLLKNLQNVDFEILSHDLNYRLADVFFEKINGLIELKNKESIFSELIRDFNSTRESIVELFIKIHDEDENNNFEHSECPLCGYYWPDGYEEVLSQIEEKETKIEKIKSQTSLEIDKEYNNLYDNYIETLNNLIEEFLQQEQYNINADYFKEIDLNENQELEIIELLKWLENNGINISEISYKELNNFPTEISSRIDELILKIISKKEVVPIDFNFSQFNITYNLFFNGEEQNIKHISSERLQNKALYIDQQFFNGNSLMISTLENQNEFIVNSQILKLKEVQVRLQEIWNIYSNNIKKHRRQIAKNIELPFFIISSKILQSFEYGCGLFIKWNQSNKTENLKFTQGYKTSHDAIYSMSSGQLSALVISFTLSMNKVFDKSNFGLLLIDDPTQTMDEINMSSLVELLRNDFFDKQILVSTHEEEVSHFMRFKFSQFNSATGSINMKDKQFVESQK